MRIGEQDRTRGSASAKRLALALLGVTSFLATSPSPLAGTTEDGELQDVLYKLDRVAALYRDRALQFTCDEKIVLTRPSGNGFTRKYRYVYVRDDAGRLLDHRSPRRADQAGSVQQVDMGDSGLPSYVSRAYSSVFLFEKETQQHYRYEILGHVEALGRPAIKIGLEPRVPDTSEPDRWHGVVWIDGSSYQLLQFEGMEHEDFERNLLFEQQLERWEAGDGKKPDAVDVQQVSTKFGEQKNGMRFPSAVTIVATRLYPPRSRQRSGKEVRIFKVTQKYARYQFYGVRTSEEIVQLVFADERPPE